MRVYCQGGGVVDIPTGSRATVEDANLHRAILERADLSATTFERCVLRNGLFLLAHMPRVRVIECHAAAAEFGGACLRDAEFFGGMLNSASFTGANLTGATFAGVALTGVDFRASNLDCADFTEAGPLESDFEGAFYTTGTRWPARFDPSAHRMHLVGEAERVERDWRLRKRP